MFENKELLHGVRELRFILTSARIGIAVEVDPRLADGAVRVVRSGQLPVRNNVQCLLQRGMLVVRMPYPKSKVSAKNSRDAAAGISNKSSAVPKPEFLKQGRIWITAVRSPLATIIIYVPPDMPRTVFN